MILILIFIILYYCITTYRLFTSQSAKNITDEEKIKISLQIGRLTKLPQNMSEFKIDGTSNAFSSTYVFKFKSNKYDIENLFWSLRA